MREIDLAVSSEAIKEVQKRLLVEFGGVWKEWRSKDEVGIIASKRHRVGKNGSEQTSTSVLEAR